MKITEIVDRAMTSGSIIGVEHYQNHSLAWETEREIFTKNLLSLFSQLIEEAIGEDEKEFDATEDQLELLHKLIGRNQGRQNVRLKAKELIEK